MNFKRSSGILLHPTSLPSPYGIGTLGKEAYAFVDFLKNSSQKLWQTFPLGPTGYGDSPYQCFSAFAGNPLLIDMDILIENELLSKQDIAPPDFQNDKIDYGTLIDFKLPLLKKSYENFCNNNNQSEKNNFEIFNNKNHFWLHDYALYRAIKDTFDGKSWLFWDKNIKFREKSTLAKYENELNFEINFHKYMQFQFFKQWLALKKYANENNIKIIGDIPIFVSLDSSDAWANPELFLFDKDRNPVKVAGVPPDYFSATGQLWGNPLYDWDYLEKTNFEWWIKRIQMNFEISDFVRIDHFRGFEAYWAVPSDEETAINGEWIKCPGKKMFEEIEKKLGKTAIIAEDLGIITPEVEDLRDSFNFPGMKILQFAFNPNEDNPYLPHNHIKNCVIYTGTHDNNTTLGWYQNLSIEEKNFIKNYLKLDSEENISWDLIQCAWSSVAAFAICPLQDILSLDNSGRMNTPGVASDNWQWRFKNDDLTNELSEKLSELTKLYFR